MSAEFEKVVLEKLKVLDELKVEVTNLSKKADQLEDKVDNNTTLINNLSTKVDNLEEKVNSNTTLINNLSEKVQNNTTLINNLSVKVGQVEEKVNSNTTLINNLSEKVQNNTTLINNLSVKVGQVEEKVDQHSLNFAEFENEFTIKVQALFDSFVANTESHLSFTKAIAALNSENFHQGIRISKLENFNNNTKILANN